MTRPGPFEPRLEAWLDEGPAGAPPGLLGEVLGAIPATTPTRRPFGADRRFPVLSASIRFLATFAAVLVIGVVGFTLLQSGRPLIGPGAAGPTPIPSDSPGASPVATGVAGPSAVATEEPTASPGTAPCAPATLAARITAWDGAAGSRIATVTLTNTGSVPCDTRAMDRPQLVGGDGRILLDGPAAGTSATLTLEPGASVSTLVQDSNYCGSAPAVPVTVAFDLANGGGHLVAAPLSQGDTSGVPPCNGLPGSAGHIEMHPWAP